MIVKTRQTPGDASARSWGVLRLPPEGVEVLRHEPCAELALLVDYYWRVRWHLQGPKPHLQETLPHPNTYLVFEEGRLSVSGVSTSKFQRLLSGQGSVFGVKFRPGGLRPFLQSPVTSIADRVLPASHVFGLEATALEARLAASNTDQEMVAGAEAFLLGCRPQPDDQVRRASELVDLILSRPAMKTVEDLAGCSGQGKRSLQRLFREYVGISPKWVIQRYRLHELVARLDSGDLLNWCDLALELGYFDQAHLIRDFQSITGYTPVEYQRRSSK